MRILIFTLSLLFNMAFASSGVYEGEKQVSTYAGPLSPSFDFNRHNGDLVSQDKKFNEDFIQEYIEPDLFQLLDYTKKEVTMAEACPLDVLSENKDYIRYLYRLISISYLYEELVELSVMHSKLQANNEDCSIRWADVLGQCSPKSTDMKKFIKRSKYMYLKNFDFRRLSAFKSVELNDWNNNFQKHLSNKQENSLLKNRIQSYCKTHGCDGLKSLESLKYTIGNSCKENKKIITKVCNELDDYLGISKSSLVLDLLASSNAINVIKPNKYARGCLERYQVISSGSEQRWIHFENLFDIIYGELKSKKSSYAQGDLFLTGALREFDEGGLEDILFKPIKKVVRAKPKVKPIVVSKPKPVKMVKMAVIKEQPKPKVVLKKVKKPVVKISEFETRLKQLREQRLKEVSLEMTKFKDDFVFTGSMINLLKEKVNKLQTRRALKSMKRIDGLGSTRWPVRILFIKYFIDTNDHKALFNIKAVLGDKFYVRNDIDGKFDPVFVELKNDSETNNRWQINLVKSEPVKSPKKPSKAKAKK